MTSSEAISTLWAGRSARSKDADGIDAVHQAVPGSLEQDGGQGGTDAQQGKAREARAMSAWGRCC
jgi:hypothetical protein